MVAAPSTSTASPARFSTRQILFQIHLWIGLILCVPIVCVGLTGSLMIVLDTVEGMSHRGTAEPVPIRSVAELVGAAKSAAPPGASPSLLIMPRYIGGPATVRFAGQGRGDQQGPGAQLSVDPQTLAVSKADNGGFRRQVQMLHANFLIPGRDGRTVVGIFGLVMLGLGLSGLVLWWPKPGRWRAAFKVARGAKGYRFNRELHGATGIWGFLVFITVCFTGVDLAFPQTVGAVISSVLPARDLRAFTAKLTPGSGEALDADGAVQLATQAMPGSVVRNVGFPGRPDQPYRIGLARPTDIAGAPMATVFVDPWAKSVAEMRDPADYSAGETVLAWQHAVHSGEGTGWFWESLVFLSGLMPPLFAFTGVSMWLQKRRARRR